MRSFIKLICLFSLSAALANCANSNTSDLEKAQQELNNSEYQSAYDLASNVLADDPTNLKAAQITASSQFGLSNIDQTTLNSTLLDLQNSTSSNFSQIAAAVPATTDLDQLVAASQTLAACQCTLDLDAQFQQGIYQSYVSFIAGIVGSHYSEGISQFDPTAITDAQVAAAQTALQQFDNVLITSGVAATDDLILQTRETYCLVVDNAPTQSFDADVYRALVCCQLAATPATDCDAILLTAGVASCNTLNPDNQDDTTFDACKATDTQ